VTGRPRLIYLNGPPAAGKSSIAQRFVDEHPLALNLDIDTVRALLGRWMDDQEASGLQARRLALAMARAHLSDGHDVVVPQLVARVEFVEQLSAVADECGARFVEVCLSIAKVESRRRFAARVDPSVPGRFNAAELVAHNGGLDSLDELHDAVAAFIATRPDATVIESTTDDQNQTYAAFLTALD
jgi:predicted kinase